MPQWGIFGEEIRDININKQLILKNRNWKVIIVWENDYKDNKNKIIGEILNEINK